MMMEPTHMVIDLTEDSDDDDITQANIDIQKKHAPPASFVSTVPYGHPPPQNPLKRKSLELELDSSRKVSTPTANGILQPKTSLNAALPPSTPSPASNLVKSQNKRTSSLHAVNVVIPSPTARQQEDLDNVKTEAPFLGLSEIVYPVGREEKKAAELRKYPTSRAVDRRIVPFCIYSDPVTRDTSKPSPASSLVRRLFERKISNLAGPKVTFSVDDQKLAFLSSTFQFINESILIEPATKLEEGFYFGCDCVGPCDPDTCDCIFEEDEDESDSDSETPMQRKSPKPKIYPYDRNRRANGMMVLSPEFLEKRQMIYECSYRCKCQGRCWNNIIQHGRQIRLEIFDTRNRGFGLRSLDTVIAGQFIDRYLGEVITKYDADLREAADSRNTSYLFSLDFNLASLVNEDDLYVVDGQRFGSPTRFMNHSCNPNCKIVPVSSDTHGDPRLYDLAFFALRDIPAGTELTFDYNPTWSSEKDDNDNDDPVAVKCRCGEEQCRGQLWPNARQKGHQRTE